jgi:hypothetical protein
MIKVKYFLLKDDKITVDGTPRKVYNTIGYVEDSKVEEDSSLLAELAMRYEVHNAGMLTFDEAKMYLFSIGESWRMLTIYDIEYLYSRDPYVNIWLKDDVVHIALSISRPHIKRMLILVQER